MNMSTMPFKAVLLASSALLTSSLTMLPVVPASAAQDEAPAAQPATPPQEAPVVQSEEPPEQVLVRGMFIPDVVREAPQVATIALQEDLVRQGDDTVGQALTRLSGLSLVAGRFVYVRGLGERYSSALLNGSPLPSPEPLQRVVPLDLFPNSILSGAVVQKTYSTDYSGEFGGGVINLQTLNVPNERFFTASLSTGGNTETTFSPGLSYYGSKTDYLGFDDGTRDTPDKLAAAMASGKGRITEGNFTPQEVQAIGQDFVNAPLNLMQNLNQVAPNVKLEMSGGDRFNFSWGGLGAILVAGFDNSWRTRRGVQEEGIVTTAGDLTPTAHYDFVATRNDVLLNGMFGLGADIGNTEINWTNLYVRSVTKEARTRQGIDEINVGVPLRTDATTWYVRELANTQLTGTTQIGDLSITGRASYALTSRDAPYEKDITYRRVDNEWLHNAQSPQTANTRFSNVNDKLVSGGVDATYTLPFGGMRDAKISAGYAYSENKRSAEMREFRFLASNNGLPIEVQRQRVDYLLSDVNINTNALVLRETTGANGAASYRGYLATHGVYTQTDIEILPFVRLAAGVRYEGAVQGIGLVDLFGGPNPASPASINKAYLLPAASITWNFYEDMQLRLGASKTIARPQFRELAPQPYYDPDTFRIYTGNPYLTNSKLINVDGRWEWFFGPNQYIAAGGFYKDLDRPVEQVVLETGSTLQTTFLNAPRTKLYGGEFEARKYWEAPANLGYLSSLAWFTALNYTYSQSRVIVNANDVVYPVTGGGLPLPANIYVQNGDRLQGQSNHLVNVQFGAEDEARGLQATLLLNYASDRVSNRGRPGFPDVLVRPGMTLDFTFRKIFTNSEGTETELMFEARNLLSAEYNEFQRLGTGIVSVNKYALGQSFSLALKRRY
jgi:outer membrane receptor protein involved in Fe transport